MYILIVMFNLMDLAKGGMEGEAPWIHKEGPQRGTAPLFDSQRAAMTGLAPLVSASVWVRVGRDPCE